MTIIFGAGASYDSKPANSNIDSTTKSWQPPLTKDLFDDSKIWCSGFDRQRVNFPRGLIPVVEQIRRDTKAHTLEYALEKLKREREINPSRWAQELEIRYWLSEVIGKSTREWSNGLKGVTTYVDLIQRIDLWQVKTKTQVNFITFNYDTLLDHEVFMYQTGHENFNDSDFEIYHSDKFCLFKPHGSVDWNYEMPFDEDRESMTDRRPLSDKEKKCLRLVRNLGTTIYSFKWKDHNKVGYFPALAIPIENKSKEDFILPPGHFEKMIGAIKDTTFLIVIGWAAAEKHFMELLKTYLKPYIPVTIICAAGGGDTRKRLEEAMPYLEYHVLHHGFSSFLDIEYMLERILENKKW